MAVASRSIGLTHSTMTLLNTVGLNPRSFTGRLMALGASLTLLILVYTYTAPFAYQLDLSKFTSSRYTCSPESYSSGSWAFAPRTNTSNMTTKEQALDFAGFSGCASSREYDWHLATDKPEQWDRFPNVSSWQWIPGESCQGLRPLDPPALVKELVEEGGWLLVGGTLLL